MINIKGIVLAGGTGSRMGIVSRAINKHCNLIYKYPMIYYPIANLRGCGITEILVVTSEVSAGQFIQLLGNGKELGLDISYKFQAGAQGIADALRLGESFAEEMSVTVTLGDNFFHPHPVDIFNSWDGEGAKILLYPTDSPEDFGVLSVSPPDEHLVYDTECRNYPQVNGNVIVGQCPHSHPFAPLKSSWRDYESFDNIIDMFQKYPPTGIVEKPTEYIGNLLVTGMYMYDREVWNIIRDLSPSLRGEYEISDVNNEYIRRGLMDYSIYGGKWLDCGNPDKLLEAANYARDNVEDVYG